MPILNATPTKKLYRSIIADYDLRTAIAELVDNAIDAWAEQLGGPSLAVDIDIDIGQQSISIQDNAGGVAQKNLANLVSPGASSSDGSSPIIGIFGVGSKRAVVALAQDIRISSRHHRALTYRIEYGDEWLKDPDNWEMDYGVCEELKPSCTRIELSRLRMNVAEGTIEELAEFLGATYCRILAVMPISINLNWEPVLGKSFENWSFHPKYGPRSFTRRIRYRESKKKVRFKITGGLVREKGHEHGVYVYCNDRLICRALKNLEVGFKPGRTGHHVDYSLVRIIVELIGPSEVMPWTSNKSQINYSHELFREIRDDIIRVADHYKKISRSLIKDFDSEVLPHKEGAVPQPEALVSGQPLRPSKLPPIPKARSDYKSKTIDLNSEVTKQSPWIRGLYEAIIAEEMIDRQRILKQRTRISLIVLDSTLEIAFKDFLAWKVGLGDAKLASLFGNRIAVHDEVKKHLPLSEAKWHLIEYFYKTRCELVHRKVNVAIDQRDIVDFRALVKYVLGEAFGLAFPS